VRVIFLDFDGVIVPFAKKYQKRRPALVSAEAVTCLNAVIKETGAKLVITSSWRKFAPIEKLDECVKKWGVVGDVVGKTVSLNKSRGKEIADWLQGAPEFFHLLDPIESYVILDDEEDMDPVKDHLVKVQNPVLGLLMSEALQAIEILRGKP